jgi:hypothetical protein
MIQAIRENSTYDTKMGLSVQFFLRYHGKRIKTINCKIHLGVETEVPRFMTGGNRGGNLGTCCMTTKNDQEIIVSRKYEYELEMEVQRLNVTGLEIVGNNALLVYDNKMHTRRCIA